MVYLQLWSESILAFNHTAVQSDTPAHNVLTYIVHAPHITYCSMSIPKPAIIFLSFSGTSSIFYLFSVNKDTSAKVGMSRRPGNYQNCIVSINRNIQIWIQMNEKPKKRIICMRRPHALYMEYTYFNVYLLKFTLVNTYKLLAY